MNDQQERHHHHQQQQQQEMIYRDAVYLNNAGISCLERGFYVESIELFTDAMTLMKRSVSFNENKTFVDVNKNMSDAARFLGRVQQTATISNICPLDDHDALSEATFDHGLSSPCHFPIRIRCRNLAADKILLPQQLEIPSAIVLYNLGLANLLAFSNDVGKQPNGSKSGERLLGCAFRALSLSHCILVQQAEIEVFPELKLMQLSALVLQCLFRVFRWTSQAHQAEQVLVTLTQLVKEARQYEVILKGLNVETSNHAFAPAA